MIDNKKIPTSLGVAIIIIFAITAGMFVWQIVKKQEVTKQPQSIAIQANSDEKKQGQVELRDNNPTVTKALVRASTLMAKMPGIMDVLQSAENEDEENK